MEKVIQILERPTLRPLPTIIRKSITTAKIKKRLLGICGSKDNFEQLNGLDIDFAIGRHEYHGSLNSSQPITFIEMALERVSSACGRRPGCGCFLDEPLGEDMPNWLTGSMRWEGGLRTYDYVKLRITPGIDILFTVSRFNARLEVGLGTLTKMAFHIM